MASDMKVIDGSSIVEMEIVGDDESDYDVDLSGPGARGRQRPLSGAPDDEGEGGPELFTGVTKGQIASGMASYVWEEGRQRARRAFSVYGNIDILRPYFDVEPKVVRNRLIHSLIPKFPRSGSQQEKVPRELYGPTMLVFTMIALLLFQMKSSDHSVEEGTLMGTAFGLCFTYWLGVSSLVWSLSYVCNTHLGMLQILSLLGYALFGHCVALFFGTIFEHHSHFWFYMMWLFFGGLATLRMVSVLYSRTSGQTQKMIMCGLIAVLHMLFLLYLHFAYHKIVEELSIAMRADNPVPKMLPENDMKVPGTSQAPAVPDKAEVVVKAVTESVKRVIREVNVTKAVAVRKDTLLQAGSKLAQAILPKNLNVVHENLDGLKEGFHHAVNETGKVVLRALNGTKI